MDLQTAAEKGKRQMDLQTAGMRSNVKILEFAAWTNVDAEVMTKTATRLTGDCERNAVQQLL
jgi:hypothetical protein